MLKEVMIVTGAGQISMAIARRIGFGKKIILGDKMVLCQDFGQNKVRKFPC